MVAGEGVAGEDEEEAEGWVGEAELELVVDGEAGGRRRGRAVDVGEGGGVGVLAVEQCAMIPVGRRRRRCGGRGWCG